MNGEIRQFLTFTIGQEEYGIDVLKVQEIKGLSATTRLPNSPAYVTGVLNLRGTIVPIVDLRRKFNMESIEYDKFSAIVIVHVEGKTMGVVADRVLDVRDIPVSAIQPPSSFASPGDAAILQGIARVEDRIVILLDIDAVMLHDTAS